MAWRDGEVWLDAELLWFREQRRGSLGVPSLALAGTAARFDPHGSAPPRRASKPPAGAGWRQRRRAGDGSPHAPCRRSRSSSARPRCSRSPRCERPAGQAGPLDADPPSLTFRLEDFTFRPPEPPVVRKPAVARAPEIPRVEWNRATSTGLPYAGSLVDGTQLPVEGPDWVTWNPATDSSPNLPGWLGVTAHDPGDSLRAGRLSRRAPRRTAGRRRRHQRPRRGVAGRARLTPERPRRGRLLPAPRRRATAPSPTSGIDRGLSQDLLERFVASGARMVFVGYASGLDGRGGIVVPYPNHENHMHVRFPAPG